MGFGDPETPASYSVIILNTLFLAQNVRTSEEEVTTKVGEEKKALERSYRTRW